MLCLFNVTGVGLFFCENADSTDLGYIFPTAKTALLQQDPNKPGGLVPTKCDKFMGNPTELFVPYSSITFVQDCDEEFAMMIRASMAGLIVTNNLRDMNPRK